MGRQVLLDLSQPFAAAVVTAFVASVFATAVTLAKSGANCANVMISTVCATKENCAQVKCCCRQLFLFDYSLDMLQAGEGCLTLYTLIHHKTHYKHRLFDIEV